MTPKRPSSRLYLVLALAIAVAALLWSVQDIDWKEFLTALKRTRLDVLGLVFLLFSIWFVIRALRWQVQLGAEKPIPVLTVFWGNMVGYLGNTVLPARAGELIRSAMIGRKAGISSSYVLATVLTERIIDVPALALASVLALMALPNVPTWVIEGTQVAAVVGVAGTIGIFVTPFMEKWIKGIVEPILARLPIPGHIGGKLVSLLEEFLYGMRALHRPRRALEFAALTFVIWLLEAYIVILLATALDQALTLPESLLLLAALGFSSAIPSTPGYLGIYQAVFVGLLPVLAGYTKENALAFSIIFQVITLFCVVVWGLLGLWRMTSGTEKIPAPQPD
ncbi:MAG: lysylphosphatidylglycerol synthase transmembrane domain-containing protein [Aggregatilineales bacterium]